MVTKASASLYFFSIFITACGLPQETLSDHESDVSIVGGTEVSDSQRDERLLSTVAITTSAVPVEDGTIDMAALGKSYCTGTLIRRNVVLTAAHCLAKSRNTPFGFAPTGPGFELPTNTLVVAFGTNVLNQTWAEVAVQGYHLTFNYFAAVMPKMHIPPNDLGILLLKQDAPAPFRPAMLQFEGTPALGQLAWLTGFGLTIGVGTPDGEVSFPNDTGILRQVDAPVTKVDRSRHRIEIGVNTEYDQAKGACLGDSGGPAFFGAADGSTGSRSPAKGSFKLRGVTSVGLTDELGRCTGWAAYTDLAAYSRWIDRAIESLERARKRGATTVRIL